MDIRVRFAPSPTGWISFGNARTALYNWLFARHMGGKFLLRIEDTDSERSKPEFEADLLQGLEWLGLKWDEEIIRQSERRSVYREHLEKLLANHHAYWCFCSEEKLEAERQSQLAVGQPQIYSGTCRSIPEKEAAEKIKNGERAVIRLKTPAAKYSFEDLVRGKVEFDSAQFGDVVIAKSLDEPLYNFAVVIDDEFQKITHVIRGEDHLSNTPKQMAIAAALDIKPPHYAHLPLILGPDKKKLSKRYLAAGLREYRAQGYIPEAIINFLVLLGWHPAEDREVLSVAELIKEFALERTQKAGAIFNPEKLDWLNAHYLRNMSADEFISISRDFWSAGWREETLRRALPLVRERLKKLSDLPETGGLFFNLPEYDSTLLVWKKADANSAKQAVEDLIKGLESLSEEEFGVTAKSVVNSISEKLGRGETFWPLRVALSGRENSPGPLEILEVLGKTETLHRLEIAKQKLN
jgi:glutamyl-tRNA synthetase